VAMTQLPAIDMTSAAMLTPTARKGTRPRANADAPPHEADRST
jgi:hypothetical protein